MSTVNIADEVKHIERFKYDVLVIGAGGAGLRAAIAAAENGASVGIVCKSLLGKAHTVMAEGGCAASLGNTDERDNWMVHFKDTMKGGNFHNNWRMAELHAKQAPDRVRELERWGAVFDRTKDGKISQRDFGGHTYPRLAHIGDRTGLEMIRTLQEKAITLDNITVYMECTIIRLFKANGKVVGAFGYRRQTGNFLVFDAKAIILATGGTGKVYRVTSNSWEYTGDGLSLAYNVGADLVDLEFIQFHPTGMVFPGSIRGALVTEAVRGEGGLLLNSEGKRFMFHYIPELYKKETADTEEEANRYIHGDRTARKPPELLKRDIVSRAILQEVKEGRGSVHGGAYLDIASIRSPDYIKKKLPSMYHQFKTLANVDITKEPMEVAPTTHYMMGGIRVDADTEATTVPGLYAAGEVAGGMHGANRLGGNSLSDLIVFGKLAGDAAAKYAAEQRNIQQIVEKDIEQAINDALEPFSPDKTEDAYQIHEEIQKVMEEHVSIYRDEAGLLEGIKKLEALAERAKKAGTKGTRIYNPGWHLAIDVQNMIWTAMAITHAALLRKESRGGQARVDYQETNKDLTNVLYIIRKGPDGKVQRVEDKYAPMPEELKKLVEETH